MGKLEKTSKKSATAASKNVKKAGKKLKAAVEEVVKTPVKTSKKK